MSRIISIGTAVPQYSAKQNDILEFMQNAYADKTASRKLNILFHSSGINTRHSVVPDFNTSTAKLLFDGASQPEIEERLAVYKKEAFGLAIKAINQSFNNLQTTVTKLGITHLITVTCTGLYSPGMDAEIIKKLDLPNDIFHTSINFMGCNAAFPAMKIADSFAKSDENAKVLVVCVELCTLHFQPKNNNDNLLSNTIFGDGAAAVIVVSDDFAKENHLKGFSINGFYSAILNKGESLMGWNITPLNFEMILDVGVPEFIGDNISGMLEQAGEKLNFAIASINKWAVHPGGRKILDVVRKILNLDDDELAHSYHVLKQYGNMSSPTILFVLKEILNNSIQRKENVFSIGFGPGISIDTSLLTYEE